MLFPIGMYNPPTPINWFQSVPAIFTRTDGPYTLGCSFSVTTPITVHAFGRYYAGGDVQNHEISLWDEAGGMFGTVLWYDILIEAASPSDADGYKWKSVTPLTLVPGSTYRIGMNEYSSGDPWFEESVPDLGPEFVCHNSYYSLLLSAYPNGAGAVGKCYTTPAIKYTVN